MTIDCLFEKVSRFDTDSDNLVMPKRGTADSAGYDLPCAADSIIIPSLSLLCKRQQKKIQSLDTSFLTLSEMKNLNKQLSTQLTLVPTGIKCKIPKGYYLELSVRSSTPLNYYLMLANGVGIIDADYYNNESNEGEIFLQLINLSDYNIMLQKNDIVCQGILKKYYITKDDSIEGIRRGGLGSTSE